jgi:hypothetical protein
MVELRGSERLQQLLDMFNADLRKLAEARFPSLRIANVIDKSLTSIPVYEDLTITDLVNEGRSFHRQAQMDTVFFQKVVQKFFYSYISNSAAGFGTMGIDTKILVDPFQPYYKHMIDILWHLLENEKSGLM